MTDPNIFIIVATIVFLALGVMWSKEDALELFFKVLLFLMGTWGLLLTNKIYF